MLITQFIEFDTCKYLPNSPKRQTKQYKYCYGLKHNAECAQERQGAWNDSQITHSLAKRAVHHHWTDNDRRDSEEQQRNVGKAS